MLYDSPTAGLDPITANTIIALIIKARDTKNSTSLIVSHRYQDGYLMANFRYNPQSGELERAAPGSGVRENTAFMVLWAVLLVGVIPASLGRCEHHHVLLNGMGAFLITLPVLACRIGGY